MYDVLATVNRIVCLTICHRLAKITKFYKEICNYLEYNDGLSFGSLTAGEIIYKLFLNMLLKLQSCTFTITGDLHVL